MIIFILLPAGCVSEPSNTDSSGAGEEGLFPVLECFDLLEDERPVNSVSGSVIVRLYCCRRIKNWYKPKTEHNFITFFSPIIFNFISSFTVPLLKVSIQWVVFIIVSSKAAVRSGSNSVSLSGQNVLVYVLGLTKESQCQIGMFMYPIQTLPKCSFV